MKITSENISVQNIVEKPIVSSATTKIKTSNQENSQPVVSEITDNKGKPTKEAYKIAVNKMNEFMEVTNKNSKFIFHEGLDKYYVEIVDAKTDEVVKEIPPKELLDAYYEMQKMIGKIIDKTV